MTQTYKKKLIEVAIPLEAINAASAREKSIRHGHPSTLHLWWARRPLAACRAVLFAQLVDDPSSLPDQFPTAELQDAERKRLFAIIEDLVKWENSTNEEVLERARAEIRRSCGGVLPPVYDPFSGGGSIPLEAQRLGLPAYGSDLNPVAVMIGKAMIEIPPKFKDQKPIHPGIKDRNHYLNAEGLAEDVKYYGEWMREKAWERIGHLYPQVDLPKEIGGGKATVIAWIWARTVPSPDPAFSDVQVPIASSFLLSAVPKKQARIVPIVDKVKKTLEFEIHLGGTEEQISAAKLGTKSSRGANFVCLMSGAAISSAYVKQVAKAGKLGTRLIAIIAEGKNNRVFLKPSPAHEEIALSAVATTRPEILLPNHSQYIGVLGYGFEGFGDIFLERQIVGLNAFSDAIGEVRSQILKDGSSNRNVVDDVGLADGGMGLKAYSDAVSVFLSFVVSSQSDRMSTLCTWDAGGPTWGTKTRSTFSRQALPMTWDFCEINPFSSQSGSFENSLSYTAKGISFSPNAGGKIIQLNAQDDSSEIPPSIISSDPPYYDNIPYADLSDYFYHWLRRSLRDVYPTLFSTIAVPKFEELVADRMRHGGAEKAEEFFMTGMTAAIRKMRERSLEGFPTTIYYAFKQREIAAEGISSTGWASFLQAVLDAGFAVLGTWPMRTELATRMRAVGSNALANSVVLVCRKKETSAETITRAEFIRALKRELPSAIKELQAASIAPADMPQSAIGPGMGVFSRYRAVLESDDSPMSVKAALQLINRELDEYLGGIQGEFDADTRFAITWFEQNGLKQGDYGTANNIANARGISVESVKHAGIVESQAGKVRILRRDELNEEWEPAEDTHLTVWECCQHLVRLHEKHGIGYETAVMLKKIGSKSDDVRDLAYVLYDICANKRSDAKEATSYNALIADWTDLTREAAAAPLSMKSGQMKFDV
jgi:putative DNA methylase